MFRRGPSRSAWLLSVVVAPASAAACLAITDLVLWQGYRCPVLVLYPLRIVLLAVAAGALLAGFALGVGRVRPPRSVLRAWTVLLALALVLWLLEVAFMFVPRSHNVGYTLAARVWHHYHWGRENSLGYRDAEPVRVPGRRLVFAVGDSLTAGWGLTDVAQRFGEVLAAARPDLQVMNLGVSGADTVTEFERLRAHPMKPDVLVLQYFPNDIEAAAQRAGNALPAFSPYADLPRLLRPIVRGSFVANFVYWQLPHIDAARYARFLMAAYEDPATRRLHENDLERFCTWSREQQVPLVVVLFPMLVDLAWSRTAMAPVARLFARHGVPVLDVADVAADLPVAERIVNNHDGHASTLLHRRIGDRLAAMLPR